jgi:hypothetical protein
MFPLPLVFPSGLSDPVWTLAAAEEDMALLLLFEGIASFGRQDAGAPWREGAGFKKKFVGRAYLPDIGPLKTRLCLMNRLCRAYLPDIGPLKTRLRLMKRPVSGRVARPTSHVVLRAKSHSPIG